ncbi:MAG: 3-dehydroquinate synthase [Salaquimonas sp.]
MNEQSKLIVELGERSYPIYIGSNLLENAGHMIATIRPGARCAIVSDDNVMAAHGETLQRSFEMAGIEASTIVVTPGEQSKSMVALENVVSQILDAKLERNDLIIAFGGGVVGDLAGFAASITRRGMDFVQIPTSLLAQVDSSVGGKTGINSSHGKNLIGAFHQPIMVIADTDVLRTLSKREFAAGYAEVAKYGLINKPDFFHWLENTHKEIFAFGPALQNAVMTSCQSKADIVSLDEKEQGNRALLNLGHTFGHALEAMARYDNKRLVHGEGVSIGMVLAHQFSNRLNQCSIEDVERVERHLKACGLPTRISEIPGKLPSAEELLAYISQDKKVSRGKLTFILTKDIGKSYIANDVSPNEVLAFLKEALV